MPHSSELELFLNGVAIFLFFIGNPSLGCPIDIKSSRIQCIHLEVIEHKMCVLASATTFVYSISGAAVTLETERIKGSSP
jgi:hypothetical protein